MKTIDELIDELNAHPSSRATLEEVLDRLSHENTKELQIYLPKLAKIIPAEDISLNQKFAALQKHLKRAISKQKLVSSPLDLFLEKVHRAQERKIPLSVETKEEIDHKQSQKKSADYPPPLQPKDFIIQALCGQIIEAFLKEHRLLQGSLAPWKDSFEHREVLLLKHLADKAQQQSESEDSEIEIVACKTLLSAFFKEPTLSTAFDFFKSKGMSEDAVFQALMQTVTFIQASDQNLFALRIWLRISPWLKNTDDAEYIFASLQRIWKKLGRKGFQWNSEEGLAAFKEKLSRKSLPHAKQLAIY